MPENVAPMPEASSSPGWRDAEQEERLGRVTARLSRIADELPQTMGWVEAEVEALRSEVQYALKAMAERAASDREELVRQVALLHETVAAMGDALKALRDEVIARRAPAARSAEPRTAGPATRSGLGLPPRRPRS